MRTRIRHSATTQIGNEIFQFQAGQGVVCLYGMAADSFGHGVFAKAGKIHLASGSF